MILRTKNVGLIASLPLMATLALAPAYAQTVMSYFNFNNLTDPAAPGSNPMNADFGNGTLTTNFEAANVLNFGGTTINAEFSDVSGRALALQGGLNGVNNGRFVTLQVNTTGWYDLKLSYATQRTATGFNNNQLSYSTDGTNFTNFGAAYDPSLSTVGFAAQSFDLSSLNGLENKSSVFLRVMFDGATTTSGNNRIDNLKLTAGVVPGPSSLAVFAFGGIAPAMALLRRRRIAK